MTQYPGQQTNWQPVLDRLPRGYAEFNDRETVLHGPVQSLRASDDGQLLIVRTEWAAIMTLKNGIPTGPWRVFSREPIDLQRFPNGVPYEIESTPEKGERVRFGLNIIYFECRGVLTLEKIDEMNKEKPEESTPASC